MIGPAKLVLLPIVGLFWNLISVNQAWGTTVTENFTTISQKDATHSTGDWNLALSQARTGFAVDTNGGGYSEDDTMNIGNGADGACTFTAGNINTNVQSVFNCTILTVNAGTTTVTGSNPLIFRILGPVTITGVLSADGSVGATGGTAGACPAAGGTAGGGGFSGGASPSSADGNPGSDGGTGGAGGGGLSTLGGGSFSGGGGGASYGSSLLGANGASVTVAGGSAGIAYGNQNNFNTTFQGGSGGGAGGGHTAPAACGGGGGGSGGAIQISAGANITVNGAITANGGAGGPALDTRTGGGGGGSGGAIFLQTIGIISNIGAISASGGAPGASGGSGGAGGAGGDGRIRLEDRTGVAGGVVTPNAQMPDGSNFISTVSFTQTSTIIESIGYDITEASPTYLAPTITDAANGGTIVYEFAGSLDNTSFSSFVSLANITLLDGLRFIKFRATLQRNAGTPGTSPTISSIALNTSGVPYTGPIQVSGNSAVNNFSTGVGCGFVSERKNMSFFSISVIFLMLIAPFFLVQVLKRQADAQLKRLIDIAHSPTKGI